MPDVAAMKTSVATVTAAILAEVTSWVSTGFDYTCPANKSSATSSCEKTQKTRAATNGAPNREDF